MKKKQEEMSAGMGGMSGGMGIGPEMGGGADMAGAGMEGEGGAEMTPPAE